MRFSFNDHVKAVHDPPISEVRDWISSRPSGAAPLVDLCQAVPDYLPAPELLAYLHTAIEDQQSCRYSQDEGLMEVREAVCDRYRRRYSAKMSTNQICLTCGASQAFWLALLVLCHAGDEVILQLPCYFDHPMAMNALGIRPVYAPFKEKERGVPDLEAISKLITPRTRAILLVTPGNPTGTAIPPERLRSLFLLARHHRIPLVLDETYADFVGEMPHDLFTIEDWHSTMVHIMSFGKSYAMTGYRPGLLAASPEFIRQALKIQDTMTVCQPRITQMGLKFALDRLDNWVEAKRMMMSLRHNLFVDEFQQPGNRFRLVASGSFFAWVKHPFSGRSGRDVAKKLLLEAGIMTLPGEVFGPGLEDYLRLAFGNIRENSIADAVRRFRRMG